MYAGIDITQNTVHNLLRHDSYLLTALTCLYILTSNVFYTLTATLATISADEVLFSALVIALVL
jgi:hypothetical protein